MTQPKPTLLDRLLAAYPLLVAYLVLLTLYAWQTTRIPSPWIFTDELKWSLLSRVDRTHRPARSCASTPRSVSSLYSYFLAPAWWAGATAPGLRGREVPERGRHDRDALPGVRAGAARSSPRRPALLVGGRAQPRSRRSR